MLDSQAVNRFNLLEALGLAELVLSQGGIHPETNLRHYLISRRLLVYCRGDNDLVEVSLEP